ncbi:hypothetical protein DFQ30_004758, partial [Apophysomyces sp. BC1015]
SQEIDIIADSEFRIEEVGGGRDKVINDTFANSIVKRGDTVLELSIPDRQAIIVQPLFKLFSPLWCTAGVTSSASKTDIKVTE